MSKPTIFFSHSSRDQKALARLKELFVNKTGGSIDVFLSSDGQSIPLGRNWVHRIQEALEQSALMVVFVTPSSLRSHWIFFESGFAYAKNTRVVPVGFLEVNLANLPPPLSLLQGFNITSEEGLNNLIAIANEQFGHKHSARFSASEYQEVCGAGGALSRVVFGDHGPLIDRVRIWLSPEMGLDHYPEEALTLIERFLDGQGIEWERSENDLNLHGVSFCAISDRSPGSYGLRTLCDPELADVAFPLIEKAFREVRGAGMRGVVIWLDFVSSVECLTSRHKLTGRIYGSDIKLARDNQLVRGDIRFRLVNKTRLDREEPAPRKPASVQLGLEMLSDSIPLAQIRELLDLLFEREILFVPPS